MDDVAADRRRKGDAFPSPGLTPGLLPSSSFPPGSSPLPSAAAATIVLALPVSRNFAPGSLASTLLAGAMDGGGGEALLVRRSKGKKRPPPAALPAEERGYSGGGGDRFQALWRDYHDLLEETEAKKRMLERANRIKLRLLAEVKFLRRKYEFFVKANSQQPHYKLKVQARQNPPLVGINEASAFTGTEVPSTSKNTNLDLNQDSIMNDEEFDCRGHQGHSKLGKFDQDGVDEDMMTTDVKFSVCRDTGNSPSSDDKRTVSWQDRLALQA